MDPLTATMIAGSAGLSWLGTRSQNRAAKQAADRQMQFQERMSSSAYQRQAEDMAKAGINPLYGFGGGASAPGGATYAPSNELGAVSSSALDVMRQRAEINKIKADTAFTDALATGARADNVGKEIEAAISKTESGKNLSWINRFVGSFTGLRGLFRK